MKKFILVSILIVFFSCNNIDLPKPNVIIIYADDLGYGDVSSYGLGTLQTPNIDKIANEGIRFTNGYASSATCSPSRYALMTGTYPWRNNKAKILTGANLIIDTTEMTLPKMFKSMGYRTGIVGKWHIGLGSENNRVNLVVNNLTREIIKETKAVFGTINYNRKVKPGPNEVGFDHSFIMADTQDRVPTVYIENGNVVNLDPSDPLEVSFRGNFEGEPTGLNNPELLSMMWHHGHNSSIVNGVPRIGFQRGGKSAMWSDIDMADKFLDEAKKYINSVKDEPFFLYYTLQQPHVPRTPHPRFEGSSGMGPRGDVIVEADWVYR